MLQTLTKYFIKNPNSLNIFPLLLFKSAYKLLPSFGSNLLNNRDFSSGIDSWNSYAQNENDVTFNVVNEKLVIQVNQSGEFEWSHGFLQGGIQISQGSSYKLSFDAYGNSQTLTAIVGINEDPWNTFWRNDYRIENFGLLSQNYRFIETKIATCQIIVQSRNKIAGY